MSALVPSRSSPVPVSMRTEPLAVHEWNVSVQAISFGVDREEVGAEHEVGAAKEGVLPTEAEKIIRLAHFFVADKYATSVYTTFLNVWPWIAWSRNRLCSRWVDRVVVY